MPLRMVLKTRGREDQMGNGPLVLAAASLMALCFLLGRYSSSQPAAVTAEGSSSVEVSEASLRVLLDAATAATRNSTADVHMGVNATEAAKQHAKAMADAAIAKAHAAFDAQAEKMTEAYSSASRSMSAALPDPEAFAREYLQHSGLAQMRPPVKQGESGDESLTVVPSQILSWYPRILLFPNFISKSDAEHIMGLAKDKLQPSEVKWKADSVPDPKQKMRTSTGTFLPKDDDPKGVLGQLEDKVARVTLLPAKHGEDFYILRYEKGQQYDSHHDHFSEEDFGKQESNRIATMLIYLTDVEEGGETVFKREGQDGVNRTVASLETCEQHEFKYKPRQGDALLFYTFNPDLTVDVRALHGGCPVIKGEKWVATKWLHEKPTTRAEDIEPEEAETAAVQ